MKLFILTVAALALTACGDQRPAHYGGLTEIGLNIVSNRTGCPMNDLRISDRREISLLSVAWTAQCSPTGAIYDCSQKGGVTQCLLR